MASNLTDSEGGAEERMTGGPAVCRQVHTVVTNEGHGESVIAHLHPQAAREQIAAGVQAALESDRAAHVRPTAAHFELVRPPALLLLLLLLLPNLHA